MNNKRWACYFATILSLACIGAPAEAGWTQPEGEGYLKLWGHFLTGSKAFDASGAIIDVESYAIGSANIYGELGITDAWTAVAQLRPYGRASYGGRSTNFVGPLELGIRRALLTDALRLAVEARYGFAPPIGDGNLAGADEAVRFQPTVSTQMGSAELQMGYGFSPAWVRTSAGARWYSSDQIDLAIFGGFQVGVSLPHGFVADVHFLLNRPIGEVTVTNVAGAGQSSYLGIGAAVSWWFLPRWGVTLGADSAAFARSNAGALVVGLGIEHRI
ncbi:MAG: hypothetical protein H0U74_21775 [Bradymonadaceae bacterium]|nr:hypothetical protein [Lujinxingiaceae bacterium]